MYRPEHHQMGLNHAYHPTLLGDALLSFEHPSLLPPQQTGIVQPQHPYYPPNIYPLVSTPHEIIMPNAEPYARRMSADTQASTDSSAPIASPLERTDGYLPGPTKAPELAPIFSVATAESTVGPTIRPGSSAASSADSNNGRSPALSSSSWSGGGGSALSSYQFPPLEHSIGPDAVPRGRPYLSVTPSENRVPAPLSSTVYSPGGYSAAGAVGSTTPIGNTSNPFSPIQPISRQSRVVSPTYLPAPGPSVTRGDYEQLMLAPGDMSGGANGFSVRPNGPNGSTPVQGQPQIATMGAPPAMGVPPIQGMPVGTQPMAAPPAQGGQPRRRGKLPKPVTEFLKKWLLAHTEHPYPTEDEKKWLCSETGLSMSQVSNWMINARRRILAPAAKANQAAAAQNVNYYSGRSAPAPAPSLRSVSSGTTTPDYHSLPMYYANKGYPDSNGPLPSPHTSDSGRRGSYGGYGPAPNVHGHGAPSSARTQVTPLATQYNMLHSPSTTTPSAGGYTPTTTAGSATSTGAGYGGYFPPPQNGAQGSGAQGSPHGTPPAGDYPGNGYAH